MDPARPAAAQPSAPARARGPAHRAVAALLVLLAAVLPVAALPAPAGAQAVEPEHHAEEGEEHMGGLDALRAGVEEDLEDATAEEHRVAGELAEAEAERDRLHALLADVERRAALAVSELEAAEGSLGRATAELRTAEARLRTTERQLAESLAELRDQAVESFIVGGPDEPLGAFMKAEGLRELGAAATYRDVVLEGQDRIVDRVERLKLDRVRDTEAAAAAREAADAAVLAATTKRASLDAERSELIVLQMANARAVYTHAVLLQQVQALRAGYEAQLAALAQVSDSIAAELAARQVGQVAGPAVRGTFSVPVPSGRLSSDFGPRVHPIFGGTRLHTGIDLAASVGTPIAAAGDGTVVTTGALGGYGNAVVIDHGAGLSTLYGHLSSVHVAPGDVVVRDQVIARVGNTGNSTGPHLHLEVRLFGTPVDPVSYL